MMPLNTLGQLRCMVRLKDEMICRFSTIRRMGTTQKPAIFARFPASSLVLPKRMDEVEPEPPPIPCTLACSLLNASDSASFARSALWSISGRSR